MGIDEALEISRITVDDQTFRALSANQQLLAALEVIGGSPDQIQHTAIFMLNCSLAALGGPDSLINYSQSIPSLTP